ncbi:RNA-directed DNA polymerase [Flavobacterium sp. P4023]|uniref:RNA-directed DNA polymerase n=1 Tax=Flavobacterium flabelliforme TaxID=2816119 RepID=A0ABS5CUC3_9FLAO|nr:antiviral reverse transcriptase Drt3b [Flavobacterium flabelliforme]MBP4142217.1 RNA-directed DNA polymerase [Flavobacterium flabelliforme]
MSKKKKYIQYPKERAILSDVLPYEIPITFSNRYLYRFLVENNICIDDDKIVFKNDFEGDDLIAFKEILKILFHPDFENKEDYKFRRIPFTYRITHKEKDFRELALIHPINQLKLIKFYEDFKESILYSCSISSFSIRKPVEVAKYSFFNDKLHELNKGDNNDFLELNGREYENLKTFFSYKQYTNIYKFYEDYRYHRAEKKYNFLFKFDIAKCFDSIYTHSISWAVLGLDPVKENVDASKKNFSGIFDKFIQYSNYGETNGILIGPEFSRIFAEIILQRIDKIVEEKIKLKGFTNKIDYELYRYVDDYFLFCDDDSLKEDIFKIFKHELKEYKLSINNSKTIEYKKPIITEITIAKEKINRLFSETPRFLIKKLDKKESSVEENKDDIEILNHKFSFYFNPDNLITQYKILIKESTVDYKDVLNYSLALLNNIIERNLVNFEKVYLAYKSKIQLGEISDINEISKLDKVEDSLTSHLVNFIDFVFFIYSVSPRVNSTIKTCHILSKILVFYKLKRKSDKKFILSTNNRNRIFKKILDESSLIIKKNSINEYAQIETLYLLTVIRELNREFRIPEVLLEKFIGFDNKKNEIPDCQLNYFSIMVLLFYLGHSKKYQKIKVAIKIYIENYIKSFPIEKRNKSSELTHLIIDLIVCPFLSTQDKRRIFAIYKNSKGVNELKNDFETLDKIRFFQKRHMKYGFTKWERFNLAKELEYKKSQEVYS